MEAFFTYADSLSVIVLFAMMVGYFCGSLPFGLFISQYWLDQDIRQIGSGNIGATNVLRSGNKSAALATLALDIIKGALPCILFLLITPKIIALDIALLAGFSAIIGHVFPCWIAFKGGKGVATTLGVITIVHPSIGLIVIGTWFVTAAITRYSSVAALLSIGILLPLALIIEIGVSSQFVFGLITILLFIRHKDNLLRLLNNTETQISFLKPKPLPNATDINHSVTHAINADQTSNYTDKSIITSSTNTISPSINDEFYDDIPDMPADNQRQTLYSSETQENEPLEYPNSHHHIPPRT